MARNWVYQVYAEGVVEIKVVGASKEEADAAVDRLSGKEDPEIDKLIVGALKISCRCCGEPIVEDLRGYPDNSAKMPVFRIVDGKLVPA